MEKKLKTSLFLIAFITVFTFSVMSVMGALTLNNPASSSTISQLGTLNLTLASADVGGVNFTCIFYGKSTSTANSSWVSLKTLGNNTEGEGGSLFVNGTFNSTYLEDSNDYIINATCFNLSTVVGSLTSTGITIDNTDPATPSSLSPVTNDRDNDGSITFSGTVTGSRTTGCTLFFTGTNPGASSYTMTHSGDSCTYSLSSMPEQTYNWYIRASDGTDTADSSTLTEIVDINTGGAKGGALWLESQQGKEAQALAIASEGTNNTGIIVVVILVIVVIAFVLIKRR